MGFQHNMDLDFNDPLSEDTTGGDTTTETTTTTTEGADEGFVMPIIGSFGVFATDATDQVRVALKETSGTANRAADCFFHSWIIGTGPWRDSSGSAEAAAPKILLESAEGIQLDWYDI
jgi:hypothetical protein